MASYKAEYYCEFCDADYTLIVPQNQLTDRVPCEDCHRALSLVSSERLGDPSSDSNNSSGVSTPGVGGAQHNELASVLGNLAQTMMAGGVNVPPAASQNFQQHIRNLTHAGASITEIIQQFLLAAGPGMMDGETEGAHPDFVEFLKTNSNRVTPYQAYRVQFFSPLLRPAECLTPTIAEFGVTFKDLVDVLCYVFNVGRGEQGEEEKEQDGEDDDDITYRPTELTPLQLHILNSFAFEEYDDARHGCRGSDGCVAEGSYLLSKTKIFLPPTSTTTTPQKSLTGKGYTLPEIATAYNAFVSTTPGYAEHSATYILPTTNAKVPATAAAASGADDDDESTTKLAPPLLTFTRGEVTFGVKSLLLPTEENLVKNKLLTTNTAADSDSTTATTATPTRYPMTILCLDTDANPAKWPFIMTDSSKTAQKNALHLMVQYTAGQQLRAKLPVAYSATTKNNNNNAQSDDDALLLISPNEDFCCAICQCPFEVGHKSNKLHCKHTFHQDCLLQWIVKKNTCPVCRFKLPPKYPQDDHEHEPISRTAFSDYFM